MAKLFHLSGLNSCLFENPKSIPADSLHNMGHLHLYISHDLVPSGLPAAGPVWTPGRVGDSLLHQRLVMDFQLPQPDTL